MGEINRAREATFEANYRAAKSAVVTALLKDTTLDLSGMTDAKYYTVEVNTKTGDIGAISEGEEGDLTDSYEAWQATGATDPTDGKITVKVEKVDLTIGS